jgi:hypothetical protein
MREPGSFEAVRAPAEAAGAPKLDITVVFTSVQPTLRALKQAGMLAQVLAAHITLVVPQIVPYALPLDSPPVVPEFAARRFFTLAAESRIETTVRIYLCRDLWSALANILRPRSLVVLGGRKRRWPTAEMRLAKRLRGMGHEVLWVETE